MKNSFLKFVPMLLNDRNYCRRPGCPGLLHWWPRLLRLLQVTCPVGAAGADATGGTCGSSEKKGLKFRFNNLFLNKGYKKQYLSLETRYLLPFIISSVKGG